MKTEIKRIAVSTLKAVASIIILVALFSIADRIFIQIIGENTLIKATIYAVIAFFYYWVMTILIRK